MTKLGLFEAFERSNFFAPQLRIESGGALLKTSCFVCSETHFFVVMSKGMREDNRVELLALSAIEKILNDLGKQDWELVPYVFADQSSTRV